MNYKVKVTGKTTALFDFCSLSFEAKFVEYEQNGDDQLDVEEMTINGQDAAELLDSNKHFDLFDLESQVLTALNDGPC